VLTRQPQQRFRPPRTTSSNVGLRTSHIRPLRLNRSRSVGIAPAAVRRHAGFGADSRLDRTAVAESPPAETIWPPQPQQQPRPQHQQPQLGQPWSNCRRWERPSSCDTECPCKRLESAASAPFTAEPLQNESGAAAPSTAATSAPATAGWTSLVPPWSNYRRRKTIQQLRCNVRASG